MAGPTDSSSMTQFAATGHRSVRDLTGSVTRQFKGPRATSLGEAPAEPPLVFGNWAFVGHRSFFQASPVSRSNARASVPTNAVLPSASLHRDGNVLGGR